MVLRAFDDLPTLPEPIMSEPKLPAVSVSDRRALEHAIKLSGTDTGSRIYSRAALVALALQRESYEREIFRLRGKTVWQRFVGIHRDQAGAVTAIGALLIGCMALLFQSVEHPFSFAPHTPVRSVTRSPALSGSGVAMEPKTIDREIAGETIAARPIGKVEEGRIAKRSGFATSANPKIFATGLPAPFEHARSTVREIAPALAAALTPSASLANVGKDLRVAPYENSMAAGGTIVRAPVMPDPVKRRIDAVDAIRELRAR